MSRRRTSTGLLALVLLLGGPVAASEARTFGGPYFPADTSVPSDNAGWQTLARAFPTRVKRTLIDASAGIAPPTATRIEVRPGIEYVRVRHLAHDLAVIEGAIESPALVIDLRYVRGELEESSVFGGLLTRQPLTLESLAAAEAATPEITPRHKRGPNQISVILVNRATAGPLEAVLDALQAAGQVLLVGTQTAGDTGYFIDVQASPGWRVILDDFRRARGPRLLDVGVTPGLFIEVARDTEDEAYLALDGGTPLADLLDAPVQKARLDEARLLQQFDQANSRSGSSHPPTTNFSDATPRNDTTGEAAAGGGRPFDRTLQRAVNTLIAHEALGHPLPPPGNG